MNSQNLRTDSEEFLEHRSLDELKGLWKVVHHGNLITAVAPEKTPRLVIYFRKLVNQDNPATVGDFQTQGPVAAIRVPAAELMRLPLNVVIKNSRIVKNPCTPLPSESLQTLDVDFSESQCGFINRYLQSTDTEDFMEPRRDGRTLIDNRSPDHFIIPFRDGRSPSPESNGGKAHYVAIEYGDDPYGIIIPCTEVFRFFYCTSSRMLYTILSDKILDVDRFIIDPTRSGIVDEDPEKVVIWLRQWMFNSDRRHLARLFFTEGAFEEAKRIFLRAGGHIEDGKYERALIALPPWHGKMKLRCIFKTFTSNNRERIFVTRIISAIDWNLPFREIHFGRDNDGRRVATDEERNSLPDDNRRQRSKVLAEGTEINVLENVPADDSIDPIELDDVDFEARFPALERIYSPQVEKHNQSTKNNKGKKLLPLADGSLVEGSSSNHEGLVSTILRAMEKATELRENDKKNVEGCSATLKELEVNNHSMLHERIEHLEMARVDANYAGRLDICYLPVLDQLGLLQGTLVNLLPHSIDGKSPAWIFLDTGRRHSRPVLIVRLTLDKRVRYMIDFMHQNGKRDTASLLLWHPEEVQLGDHLLEYAIRTCMRNIAVNLKGAELLRDYCGNSIKHTSSERNPLPKHVQLIEKIFTRENNLGKWVCCIEPASISTISGDMG